MAWQETLDFEAGTIDDPIVSSTAFQCCDSTHFDDSKPLMGSKSAKVSIAPGSNRLFGAVHQISTPINVGGELWVRWHINMPADFLNQWQQTGPANQRRLFQLKTGSGPALITLYSKNITATDPTTFVLSTNTFPADFVKFGDSSHFPSADKWEDFQIYIKLMANTAELIVWKNGTQILSKKTLNIEPGSTINSTGFFQFWSDPMPAAPVNAWLDFIELQSDTPSTVDSTGQAYINTPVGGISDPVPLPPTNINAMKIQIN